MKKLKFILPIFLFSLICFENVSQAQNKLFESLSEESANLNVQNTSRNIYENVKKVAINGKISLYKFNIEILNEKDFIIELDKSKYVVTVNEIDIRDKDDFTWYGHIQNKSGFVTLTYLNSQLAGNIYLNGKSYSISPFPITSTVSIYEVSPSSYPPDHPPGFDETAPVYDMATFDNISQSNAPNIIRLLVAYTNAAESGAASIGYSNMTLFLQEAISETNQSYINSNISHRVRLGIGIKVNYSESSSFSTDLARFRSTNDGYMDEIHTYRNNFSADVCIIILDNPQYCGLASGIGSSSSTAFAAVYYTCTLGNYSFGHEIGHLHGARHNPQADPNTTPFAYGHGYYNSVDNWRTVMSYDCPGGCTRIPYWSNPTVFYFGDPMGTSSVSDNARVLNETAAILAGYRSIPSNLTLTSSSNIQNEEFGEALASNSIILSSNFNVAVGGEFAAITSPSSGLFYSQPSTIKIDESTIVEIADRYNIYPNPSRGGVVGFKSLTQETNKTTLIITDEVGTILYSLKDIDDFESLKISLPSHKSGMYIFQFISGDNVEYKKVIVE